MCFKTECKYKGVVQESGDPRSKDYGTDSRRYACNETAWSILIQTTIVTGIASMLTSIAGLPECEECKEE